MGGAGPSAAAAADPGDGVDWRELLTTLIAGHDLAPEAARAAVSAMLSGTVDPALIASFLVALAAKGASATEVTAMSDALLDHAAPLVLADPDHCVDIVGTGGSRLRQDVAFNISTTASFVVAGAGVAVCKHGNRRASSSSGSTDVLEALGIAVELDGPAVARCLAETGVGFAFARAFHPAMRHVGPVRAILGIPTVFNILGPLSHPGGVRRQVIGVADPGLGPLVAGVLARRGTPRAMVVHGSDGLDELTLSGPSRIWDVVDGAVSEREIHPADVGLTATPTERLGVGAPEANAAVAREILGGGGGPRRELVLYNAAAGLLVAEVVDNLAAGVELAGESIDSGRALGCLERLVAVSNSAVSNSSDSA
jgi:anthranilate phosphoribosyltransferase